MPDCSFHIVDAFTTKPFAGNPCAVVTNADGIDTDDMLCIARETNAPETAFVLASDKADVSVRYFMPRGEIPFAGHPTIAVGHLLREMGVLKPGIAQFEFAIGVLPVDILPDKVIMTQPPALPDACADVEKTAQALGLHASELRDGLPCQLMRGGVNFLIVPVRSLEALKRINMDRRALKVLLTDFGVSAAYVFAPEGVKSETDVHARLIDPDNAGEDPFTGSAAGCMASYMHAHGLCSGTHIQLEQGHILDRPGTGELELILDTDSGKLNAVRLGGTAVISAKGMFRW